MLEAGLRIYWKLFPYYSRGKYGYWAFRNHPMLGSEHNPNVKGHTLAARVLYKKLNELGWVQ